MVDDTCESEPTGLRDDLLDESWEGDKRIIPWGWRRDEDGESASNHASLRWAKEPRLLVPILELGDDLSLTSDLCSVKGEARHDANGFRNMSVKESRRLGLDGVEYASL